MSYIYPTKQGCLHRFLGLIRQYVEWTLWPNHVVLLPQRPFVQRLFVLVGAPGSGKDQLIRAVHDLGAQHACIVPKHTSRDQLSDDGSEMICRGHPDYDLCGCDIRYTNYGDEYGIKSSQIWEGLKKGVFQVIVVSNVEAINQLYKMFGELVVLVYIYSEVKAEQYRQREEDRGNDAQYVQKRAEQYQLAFEIYLENYLAFDHVLISSGLPENLFDQMFRLFRAYERGDFSPITKSPTSERIWTEVTLGSSGKEAKIIG